LNFFPKLPAILLIYIPKIIQDQGYSQECRTYYGTFEKSNFFLDKHFDSWMGSPREGISKATTLAPPDYWFVVDTLAMSFNELIEMEVMKNGDVMIIERAGAIKFYESAQTSIKTIGVLPVISSQPNGLNGLALDPDFENSGFVFLSTISHPTVYVG